MEVRFFMLIMKKILLLLSFMALLVSCNKDSKQDWSGMEYFTFRISGCVTDNSGRPIEGISVSALGGETFTQVDGEYVLEGRGGSEISVFLNFSDKDGMENGGRYTSASRNVVLHYIKGKHGPYLGLFGRSDVNVTMVLGLTPSIGTDTPL